MENNGTPTPVTVTPVPSIAHQHQQYAYPNSSTSSNISHNPAIISLGRVTDIDNFHMIPQLEMYIEHSQWSAILASIKSTVNTSHAQVCCFEGLLCVCCFGFIPISFLCHPCCVTHHLKAQLMDCCIAINRRYYRGHRVFFSEGLYLFVDITSFQHFESPVGYATIVSPVVPVAQQVVVSVSPISADQAIQASIKSNHDNNSLQSSTHSASDLLPYNPAAVTNVNEPSGDRIAQAVVPYNVFPGMTFTERSPIGTAIKITVPEGYASGDKILYKY